MSEAIPFIDFSKTSYFSESQKQWIQVDSMPMPYVRNVYKKLQDVPGFTGSPLSQALEQRLMPTRAVAKSLLAAHGACSYYAPHQDQPIRKMFYALFKQLGVKGTTERKGDFIEARCEPVGEEVTVNKV